MHKEMIDTKQRKILIELICNEQTHMIMKDYTRYESEKYRELEELKVKIKDWGRKEEYQDFCQEIRKNVAVFSIS